MKMNARCCSDFQNGIIELFKVHKIYDLNIIDCQRKGDVTCEIVPYKLNLIQITIFFVGKRRNRPKNNKNCRKFGPEQ